MKVGQYCKRPVVSISEKAEVLEAARLMRDRHIGFIVVIDEDDPLRKPSGVLTDRDLVLQVMAREVDPRDLVVKDVMTRQPMTASESDDVGDLMQGLRLAGIRRVPVVDTRGSLTGVIAVDDVVDLVAGLLGDIAGSVKNEQRREWSSRRDLGRTGDR